MKRTEQTLLEQLQITDLEIEHRKQLVSMTASDVTALKSARPVVDRHIGNLVDTFYEIQTSIPEISLLIGDADTLTRLHDFQHQYILDLFSGVYDQEYVNNRLRIGLVHKRIGVEPKLYLSAVHTLKTLLADLLTEQIHQSEELDKVLRALEKIFLFDITLIFETYIRSLILEIEISKEKSDEYARDLEKKVKERTEQLEKHSRTDPLTGLLNMHHLEDILTSSLRAAHRRSEPLTLVFMDIDDFKLVNDRHGHRRGDELLRILGACIQGVSRKEDSCFRYGGDEFCVILPNCKEESAREIYCARLLARLQKQSPDLELSIGVIQTGPDEYTDAHDLLDRADRRMYTEKKRQKSL